MIDPKPCVGDPCYDLGQHLLLNSDSLQDLPARADRLATWTGLDPERVRLWLFAHAVQQCLQQQPGLHAIAVTLTPH